MQKLNNIQKWQVRTMDTVRVAQRMSRRPSELEIDVGEQDTIEQIWAKMWEAIKIVAPTMCTAGFAIKIPETDWQKLVSHIVHVKGFHSESTWRNGYAVIFVSWNYFDGIPHIRCADCGGWVREGHSFNCGKPCAIR